MTAEFLYFRYQQYAPKNLIFGRTRPLWARGRRKRRFVLSCYSHGSEPRWPALPSLDGWWFEDGHSFLATWAFLRMHATYPEFLHEHLLLVVRSRFYTAAAESKSNP